eukprot:s5494_g2.t1
MRFAAALMFLTSKLETKEEPIEISAAGGLNEGDLGTQPRMWKVMKFAVVACQFLCLAALKLNEVGSGPGGPATAPIVALNATWELSQLIHRVQEADRDGAKEVLGDIVRRGGEKHLEEILGRFATMGYDYTVLLQWVSGTLKLGEASPQEAIHSKATDHSDHGFKLLLQGLNSSNQTLVKNALAQMLQSGGKEFLSSKVLELERMGYDMAAIKKWLPEGPPSHLETTHLAEEKAGISTTVPQESDVSDAQQFIDLMKMANEDGMKTKITDVFKNGGMPRIQAALKIVQAWGYDAKDVELLAAGKKMRHAGLKIREDSEDKKETKENQESTMTQSTQSTPKSQKATEKIEKEIVKKEKPTEKIEKKQKFDALEASDEALSLVKSIAEGDRDGARKEVGYIYAKGGQEELVEVLQRAQFRGHDAAKIQAWIAGDESPKLQSSQAAPVQPVQQPVAQAVQAAPVGLAHESHESHESSSELDTEFLVMRLRDGDRKGAADYVIQMFQAGGQQRIQKALAGLKLWGYDPKRFQRWVSQGVPGLVLDSAKERETTLMAMVEALKDWNRPKATKLLTSIFEKGGQPKVQQLFADLKSVGYNPSDVQAWLSKESPTVSATQSFPTERSQEFSDVTALAAKSAKSAKSSNSKVKLLGVQDFRIAVTDLATAQLNPSNEPTPQ